MGPSLRAAPLQEVTDEAFDGVRYDTLLGSASGQSLNRPEFRDCSNYWVTASRAASV